MARWDVGWGSRSKTVHLLLPQMRVCHEMGGGLWVAGCEGHPHIRRRAHRHLLHSLTHSLTRSTTHSLTHSLTHAITRSITHSITHSLTHPIPHPLNQSLTHPLNHSPTHSDRHTDRQTDRHTDSQAIPSESAAHRDKGRERIESKNQTTVNLCKK